MGITKILKRGRNDDEGEGSSSKGKGKGKGKAKDAPQENADYLKVPHKPYLPTNLKLSDLHPVLHFDRHLVNYKQFFDRLSVLFRRDIEAPRKIDWGPLEQSGLAQEVSDVLIQENGGYGFTDWERLFKLEDVIFKEFVLEVLSTARLDEKITDIQDRDFFKFVLGKQMRYMSMVDIARALGIYTDNELESEKCHQLIEFGVRFNPRPKVNEIWTRLTGLRSYNSKNASYTKLVGKPTRVIHRLLANSLNLRREHDKVNHADLFYLDIITNESMNVNLPYCVAYSLIHHAPGARTTSIMGGGLFITKFAKFFEVSLNVGGRRVTPVPENRRFIDERFYILANLIEKSDRNGKWVVVNESEHSEEDDEEDDEEEGDAGNAMDVEGHGQGQPQPQMQAGQEAGQSSGTSYDHLLGVVNSGFENMGIGFTNVNTNIGGLRENVGGLRDEVAHMRYDVDCIQQQQVWSGHQWEILEHHSIPIPGGYRMTPRPVYPPWTPGAVVPPYNPSAAYEQVYQAPWNPSWWQGPPPQND